MQVLLMRLEAPLMSFGGPQIDARGPTERVPARSMLAGLFANALGYTHAEWARTQALQDRVVFGCRCDQPGEVLREFQTVAMGQPHLLDTLAWTTWGTLDRRAGGTVSGTHIRERWYLADACYTLAVTLTDGVQEAEPNLRTLAAALDLPARPLFIGRKPCLPAAPLALGVVEAESLRSALQHAPLPTRLLRNAPVDLRLEVWLPALSEDWTTPNPSVVAVTDERDWQNQIHVGQRLWRRDRLHFATQEVAT